MKKIVYALLMLSLVACTSCKKDDDKKDEEQKETTVSNIVGTWEQYKMYDEDGWDNEFGAAYGFQIIWTFNANGRGTYVVIEDGDRENYSFTYTMKSGYLYVNYDGGDSDKLKVKTLSQKELVLDWPDDGVYYYKRTK